jgi:hypothetical protein
MVVRGPNLKSETVVDILKVKTGCLLKLFENESLINHKKGIIEAFINLMRIDVFVLLRANLLRWSRYLVWWRGNATSRKPWW